ncbi:hypothetical protein [Salsuginibacillus kocurii]|uniref:hypothetical protein n=1 Tax=Salsuginibacillus kocurii TaxID=427078 RepID=UPI00036AAFD8|nr:hypothetical protein [Salsuginibacillus kocurii]
MTRNDQAEKLREQVKTNRKIREEVNLPPRSQVHKKKKNQKKSKRRYFFQFQFIHVLFIVFVIGVFLTLIYLIWGWPL